MYRQTVRCAKPRCNEEVGMRLVDHGSNATLVEARRKCLRCGEPGLLEDALWWEMLPAYSDYKGPTLHQMALAATRKV
jgi:hypothetical protein